MASPIEDDMQLIKETAHQPIQPLSIERDWSGGHEVVIIEGVRYDADYFRTFSYPKTDVLYAVKRDDECVVLTVIQSEEQAKEFFETIGDSNG
jgi:hypothetical protein